MRIKDVIRKYFEKPWFVALLLLGVFFCTVGYKYGWDDQHVEIPLLKSLINPDLYVGDYYVQSLKKNFTSFFYILLSKVITVNSVPDVYFVLFCVSRYFLIYFIYKIWLHLSQSKFQAIACVLVFMYVSRVEEFLYRTFSHQEFALAIIFAGIYYFFKERYLLAAIILGLSANFHALYSLFPFFYMFLYLVWNVRKVGIKKIAACVLSFGVLSLPFIIWTLMNRIEFAANYQGNYKGWLNIYHYSCPQNFFFPPVPFEKLTENIANFFELTKEKTFLLALLVLNVFLNDRFKKDKKSLFFAIGAVIMLFGCFVFTYLYPQKLVLDLNLTRNTQYLHFLLIGYTTLLIIEAVDRENLLFAFGLGTLFALIKFYKGFVVYPSIGAIFCLILLARLLKKEKTLKNKVLLGITGAFLIAFLGALQFLYVNAIFKYSIMIVLLWIFIAHSLMILFLKIKKSPSVGMWAKRIFIIIPLLFYFSHYVYYNYERQRLEKHDDSFWRLRRNWIDMQKFVKARTPLDAKVLVPHDVTMGGFRIHSERTIIFSERDCGIVGFDYSAVLEWLKRYKQMGDYRSTSVKSFYKAINMGIYEYGADYVVFMRYFMPRENNLLQKVYTNTDFALYKVTHF